jgi:enoyl-[acyl-carrier-protein] reductase (NADH)
MLESVEAKIPAGRLGRPEELAELAAFLLSDAADWIRGEVVTLDGGEWIRRSGSFNDLVDLPPQIWEQLRRTTKR